MVGLRWRRCLVHGVVAVWMGSLPSCVGRPVVPSGDGEEASGGTGPVGDTSGGSADPATSLPPPSGESGSTGQAGSTSGGVPACEPAPGTHPDVIVGVAPEATAGENIVLELQCTIVSREGSSPNPVAFTLDCSDASGPLGEAVVVSVEAAGIVVPEELTPGIAVDARVQSWKSAGVEHWGNSYFVLLREGEVVLAAGNASHWPDGPSDDVSNEAFFLPLRLESLGTPCPAEPVECHAPGRAMLRVRANGESATVLDFDVGSVGGYDVHVGLMIGSDSPDCGEHGLSAFSFAIARQ